MDGTRNISVGVLTVSDTCSQGESEDTSGKNLEIIVNTLLGPNVSVIARDCVPDDCAIIKNKLIEWSDSSRLDIILTTGGTGFGVRDVTPEATRTVIEKEAPGLATVMLIESLKVTELAVLSRAVCGIRKNTLIINLPGSKKGSEECFSVIYKCLPHAVSLLKNKTDDIKKEHSLIQGSTGDANRNHKDHENGHHHHHHHHHRHHGDHSNNGQNVKSQIDISRVARRQREQVSFPMIDLNDAVDIVTKHAVHTVVEKIDLRNEESRLNIIGRVLAERVVAVEPFPPFPASIKDGYAVIASDGTGPRKVVGDRVAGSSPDLYPQGERICVRVNTGAPVPLSMNAVVQVEDTELIEEADDGRTEVSINILTKPVVGQDIRPIGSDIEKGQCVIEENTIITSTELGLLATLGINEINVFKLPSIGILSTGDELTDPWSKDTPKPGCIRDSNKITLIQLLKENGFEAIDCGVALDNPDDVLRKMTSALEKVDVLITSGSVSMGERDVIKSVLKTDLGAEIHFGRVNMKPGKPVTFATCNGHDDKIKLVFALPGNPSSAVVTFHVFVLPALRRLTGKKHFLNELAVVKLNEKIMLDSRPELKRAVLCLKLENSVCRDQKARSICSLPSKEGNSNYTIIASTTGNQLSSRLASLKGANGLLCLPQRTPSLNCIEAGSSVFAYVIGKINQEIL